ncbi:MAG: DegT/DnrJ/EryC1/StrS family aminotransferase [Bryobacterales bacterium]|nr:DegT/DnrJ/EryC1/StrS family aminotransferase [Bryobacterales bacterium]
MDLGKLALFGGERSVPEGSVVSWPAPEDGHAEALRALIGSGRYHGSDHPVVRQFEEALGAHVAPLHVRAVATGTAALHTVLDYYRKPGGAVVTAALNWPGAVGPIYACGMKPRYVDVSLLDGCLDDSLADVAAGDDVAAILVPHLFGNFSRLPRLRQAASRRKIPVIDDCTISIGGILRYGPDPDFYSTAMIASGNGAKHLGAGELGVLCARNPGLIEHVDFVSVATSLRKGDKVFSPPISYGFNYRPNVFSAAIALTRLAGLEDQIRVRAGNCLSLCRSLARLPGVVPLFDEGEPGNSFCVLPLRLVPQELGLPDSGYVRDRLGTLLQAEGVPVDAWLRRPVWTYMAFDPPRLDPEGFPNTDLLLSTMLDIRDIAPPNDGTVMSHYAAAFEKVWEAIPALKDWLVQAP